MPRTLSGLYGHRAFAVAYARRAVQSSAPMNAFKSITSADDLKAAVADKPNDQITREVIEVGVDQVIQLVFMGMMMAFRKDRAKDARAVVEYRIRALDRRLRYQVKIDSGSCTVQPDGTDVPDLTLWLSLPDFLRLVTKQLNLPLAFFTLRLRLWGDRSVAKQLARWF
jgi:putative sterol carrier protein